METNKTLTAWTICLKTAEFGWLPTPVFVEAYSRLDADCKADRKLREIGAAAGRYMASADGVEFEFDYTEELEPDSIDGSAY